MGPTVMVQARVEGTLDQGSDGRDDEKRSDVGYTLKESAGLADREHGAERKKAVKDDSILLTDLWKTAGESRVLSQKCETPIRTSGQMSREGLDTPV